MLQWYYCSMLFYLIAPTRNTQIWAEICDSADGSLMGRFILHHLTVKGIICLLPLRCPAQKKHQGLEKLHSWDMYRHVFFWLSYWISKEMFGQPWYYWCYDKTPPLFFDINDWITVFSPHNDLSLHWQICQQASVALSEQPQYRNPQTVVQTRTQKVFQQHTQLTCRAQTSCETCSGASPCLTSNLQPH